MEDPQVRIELETDKENNATLNNVSNLRNIEDISSKRCHDNCGERGRITKRSKLNKTDQIENLAKMAHKSSSSNSNKSKPPNYSGNRRFETHSSRLGVQYLDEDSDDGARSNHLSYEGNIWRQQERGGSSNAKDSNKSSKNHQVSQSVTCTLPDITAQPSTSGEQFSSRPKDQRNFENKKRALALNKKPNIVINSSFSSDFEDLPSSSSHATMKNHTKNLKKSSAPARNHSFNGTVSRSDTESRSENEAPQPLLSRQFRSPISKRSSRNLSDQNRSPASGDSESNSYTLSREDSVFPRSRLPIERIRGQGSPPRRQNPPHHRRQANGRNDCQSFIRNLIQSIPDVFDADDGPIELLETSPPSRQNRLRSRPVDNRETEENEGRARLSRTRQLEHTFLNDQPMRRRNNRGARQNQRDRPSRLRSETQSQRPPAIPDPIDQVRQIQEDEELARILQAEFDAEAETNAVFHVNAEDDSDDSSINDIFENNNFGDEGLSSHAHGVDSTSSSEVEEIDVVGNGYYRGPNGYRNSFSPNRINGYQQTSYVNNTGPNLRSRGHRGRARTSRANTMFHLHDLFGWAVGVNFLTENEDSSDDYEMLWNLTERLGEVIPRGMDKHEINRLPTRKFSQTSRNNNYQSDSGASSQSSSTLSPIKECQVCLSEFETNEILRILPCFHEFHAACIDRWLKNNNTCPVCRAEVNGVNTD